MFLFFVRLAASRVRVRAAVVYQPQQILILLTKATVCVSSLQKISFLQQHRSRQSRAALAKIKSVQKV